MMSHYIKKNKIAKKVSFDAPEWKKRVLRFLVTKALHGNFLCTVWLRKMQCGSSTGNFEASLNTTLLRFVITVKVFRKSEDKTLYFNRVESKAKHKLFNDDSIPGWLPPMLSDCICYFKWSNAKLWPNRKFTIFFNRNGFIGPAHFYNNG